MIRQPRSSRNRRRSACIGDVEHGRTIPRMRRLLAVVFAALLLSVASFASRTIRVDYYHAGNSKEEWFSLDRTVLEPLEWPGNPAKAIDESGLGNYLFEVREKQNGKLVYSRGFNSVFAEWRDTDEALHANRTFSESLRFPTPEGPVEVSLKARRGASFQEVWKRWSIRKI